MLIVSFLSILMIIIFLIQYTVYTIIEGMDLVDEIVRGEPPANPDRMVSVKVAADV